MVGEPENMDEVEKADLKAISILLEQELVGKNKVIIEVGSWKGNSARVLSEYGTVFCVDNWSGDGGMRTKEDASKNDIFFEFKNNLKDIWHKIKPLYMTSSIAGAIFKDKVADMVYIDANHDYDNVLNDIQVWIGKVKPGGIMAGHDFDDGHPGVKKAVKEKFTNFTNIGNTRIWWVRV